MDSLYSINCHFAEHLSVVKTVSELYLGLIREAALQISQSLSHNGTVLWCGNGGSAADSQHLAAELVGRFKMHRKALRSISLTTDTSVLTSVANDYSYEDIFSRQLEAIARECDTLIVLSTSGNSENIIRALKVATEMEVKTIALLGKDGGQAKSLADQVIVVPSDSTARIQEAHILIGHILCDLIEQELSLV